MLQEFKRLENMKDLKIDIIGDCRKAVDAIGKTRIEISKYDKDIKKIATTSSSIKAPTITAFNSISGALKTVKKDFEQLSSRKGLINEDELLSLSKGELALEGFSIILEKIIPNIGPATNVGSLAFSLHNASMGMIELIELIDLLDGKKDITHDEKITPVINTNPKENFGYQLAKTRLPNLMESGLINEEVLKRLSKQTNMSVDDLNKLVDVIEREKSGTIEKANAYDEISEKYRNQSKAITETTEAIIEQNDLNAEQTDIISDKTDEEEDYWVRKAKLAKLGEQASIDFYEKELEIALAEEERFNKREEDYNKLVQQNIEKNQWMTDIFSNSFASMGEAVGENLVLQGDIWGALGDIALNTIANIISALGTKAYVEAAEELAAGFASLAKPWSIPFAPAHFAAAAKYTAAGTLAHIAAGAVKALPKLAAGGLATAETLAVIGEGRYQEAVLPLSDEVFTKLADGITRTENYNNSKSNVNVHISFSSQFDVSDKATKRRVVRELQPLIISGLQKTGAI